MSSSEMEALKAEVRLLFKVVRALLDSGLVNDDIEYWIQEAAKQQPEARTAREVIEKWPKWKQKYGPTI